MVVARGSLRPASKPSRYCRRLVGIPAAILLSLSCVTPANAGDALAAHMSIHIALMNFLAPLIALAAIASSPLTLRPLLSRSGTLLSATITQIVAIWTAHTPTFLAFASSHAWSHAALQGALLLTALWFWGAAFSQPPRHFWRALLGLAFTGKLFCLLGALLVFAPRPLYSLHPHGSHSAGASIGIEDQQLAGILMLLACPLSYLLAGIVISSRSLKALERADGSRSLPATDIRPSWQ